MRAAVGFPAHAGDGLLPGGDPFAHHADVPQDGLRLLADEQVVVHDQRMKVLQVCGEADGTHDVFIRFQRHCDRELAADAHDAAHRYAAAHERGQVFRDGKAETRAAEHRGGGGVHLLKGVENAGQIVLRDAAAGIVDHKAQLVLIGLPPGHADVQRDLAARRKFHRVAQHVDEDLLQLHLVADVGVLHFACDGALVVEALAAHLRKDDVVDARDELREHERFVFQQHLAAFDAGHVEDVVDERQQIPRGKADFGHTVRNFFIVSHRLCGDRVHPDDRVERRADLVAHAGKEIGLGRAGLLRRHQRIGHLRAGSPGPAR
jgi:hypothetical protein